jgi:hypothetical protein
MLMASARIEVDANCKPGNPLTPILRKHAATYAERVRTETLRHRPVTTMEGTDEKRRGTGIRRSGQIALWCAHPNEPVGCH